MMRPWRTVLFLCSFSRLCGAAPLGAEQLRVFNAGNILVSLDRPGGDSVNLSYTDAAGILLDQETRFFRGIEIELIVPQTYLAHRGSLALALYANLDKTPDPGIADLEAQQISMEPIPNKIQIVYQIPIRPGHGLRNSPYAALPVGIAPPESFPLLFRILPAIKGLSEEVEIMSFRLSVKPILSDEGAVRIVPRYPEHLARRPFTTLIDDEVVERPQDTRLLKEGEHSLVIISDDYRNESRRFVIERGKILELSIALQDTIPLVYFEAPDNALIFFDNEPVDNSRQPFSAAPGLHEVRFQMGDYTMVKPLTIRRGKTYRVALAVDVSISEDD
ncbi:MAG: hypothetical protein LBU16_00070 [Treponema sp.]|jgi:hypothetical protein|nr:hypothetical protein [Treponema sp.]